MDAMFWEGEVSQDPMNVEDPRVAYPVRRLKDTIEILELILSDNRPNKILVRLGKTVLVGYGFGDVSSSGFGATFITNNALYFQYRNWSSENSKVSSNQKELKNLVVNLAQLFEQGELTSCELFLFTDNSTNEFAYHRGTSSNKFLFKLIQRVYLIQKTCEFK